MNILILGSGVAGHGGGGGDGHHQVGVLGGKCLADLSGDVIVKPGVLIIHVKVHALFQARLFQSLEEAGAAVVQRGVLAVLGDANEVLFNGRLGRVGGLGGSFGLLAAAGGKEQGKSQRQNGGSDHTKVFHKYISCSVMNVFDALILRAARLRSVRAAAPSFCIKLHIQTSREKIKSPVPSLGQDF